MQKSLAQKKKGAERKTEFVPIIAQAFIELGYARTTTASIARRCGVRENVLYRIWPNKLEMFLESIRFIFTSTLGHWQEQMSKPGSQSAIERLIRYQSKDHGQRRFFRLVFSGLVEIDDVKVRRELRKLYQNFHKRITDYIRQYRIGFSNSRKLSNEEIAWTVMGIASVVDIQRELGLMPKAKRREFMERASMNLIEKL